MRLNATREGLEEARYSEWKSRTRGREEGRKRRREQDEAEKRWGRVGNGRH